MLFDAQRAGFVILPDADACDAWEQKLGTTTSALKTALNRFCGRFHKALQAQLLKTVSSEDDFKS